MEAVKEVKGQKGQEVETDIPARLDRLPWSRFQWLVLACLGITWILDGLEVTIVGAISGILEDEKTLHLTSSEIGFVGSAYLAGAVIGSLFFAYLSDRIGRKLLFFVTLGVYLVGVFFSAFSWDIWSFAIFRFVTGFGIGGEYSAVNSAVDELIPARVRGHVALVVNGTYWLGAAIASASTLVILNPDIVGINVGWRLAFGAGGILGIGILLLRRYLPESPRWLVVHDQIKEAEKVVGEIEDQVKESSGKVLPKTNEKKLKVRPQKTFGFGPIFKSMFTDSKKQSVVGLSLMTAQAFLYNAVLFTYALNLKQFFHVPGNRTGIYLLPFALGNFLGPVVLGHFFDRIGRKPMISGTFAISAILLAATGYWFQAGHFTATSLTVMWTVIFFFASAAASSAYLTVSETFPLETRAMAIALFYSLGTGFGGVVAPWLFGILNQSGSRQYLFYGYLVAAALMLWAAIAEWLWGISAEGKSLEKIAKPLSAAIAT